MIKCIAIEVLAVAILGSAGPLQANTYSLKELRDLPGGQSFCAPFGVSADGSVIAGVGSSDSGSEAIRWSSSGLRLALGDIPHDPPRKLNSLARAVSLDGTIIVGWGTGALSQEATMWRSTTGMASLDPYPYGDSALFAANAVSADGSVVVGDGATPVSAGLFSQRAILWTAGNGDVDLGDFPGGIPNSGANAVSSDGSVVAGWGSSQLGREAFRWTQATGLVGLGDLSGGTFDSIANAITPDGNVIVGSSDSTSGNQAFRWTAAQGMVGIGDFPGGTFHSEAVSVSADGSVIVGNGNSATRGEEAFVWIADRGMFSLLDMLVEVGVTEANDWSLFHTTGMSADGRTIVGYGMYQSRIEGWIATVPEPSSALLIVCGSMAAALLAGTCRWRCQPPVKRKCRQLAMARTE